MLNTALSQIDDAFYPECLDFYKTISKFKTHRCIPRFAPTYISQKKRLPSQAVAFSFS